MNHELTASFLQDQRVQAVLTEYRAAHAAGQKLSVTDLLAQHPELEEPLRGLLFRQDTAVERTTPPPHITPPPVDPFAATLSPFVPAEPGALPYQRDFGEYELLEEIARGGMGVVFKAQQKSPHRTVALKMILAGRLASAEQVRRFRQEAEEAGNLDHPNIVPIYQVGEYQGQQFFSMRLIEGGSLAEQIDRFRGGFRAVAELLAKTARAVHYAHQRGILHRDLKPGNILLDAQGEPHITDFGLAKHLGNTAANTQSGAIVGTPSYMSPEQAASRKDLSVATDVWSLGAILYELLTGRPPFVAETALDTVLQVLEKDPPPPRTLRPDVDPDLETICLKCLEKDPQRRYLSALRLAEDLERQLAGEPIHARPVRFVERLGKWVKRRPAAAALVGVSVLALLLLGSGGWAMNLRLQAALQDAEERRQDADAQRGRAEAGQREGERLRQLAEGRREEAERQRQAAEDQEKLATAGLRNRQETIERMVLNMDQRLANLGNAEVAAVRLEFLQEVLKMSQGVLKDFPNDPKVRQQTAQLYRRIADLQRLNLREYREAGEAFQQALKLQEALVQEFPEQRTYRADLALMLAHEARLYRSQKKSSEALLGFEKAVGLLDQLAVEAPKMATYQENACVYRFERADLLHQARQLAAAEQTYRETLERRETLAASFTGRPVNHTNLARAAANLAHLLSKENPAEAQRCLERALAAHRQVVKLTSGSRTGQGQLYDAYNELAEFLRRQGQHAELPRLAATLRQDFPSDSNQTFNAACFLADAVKVVQGRQELAEAERARLAEEYAQQAIDFLRKAIGEGYTDRAHMDKDSDLDPIRQRKDFQELRADLDKRFPSPPQTVAREHLALAREFEDAQYSFESRRDRATTLAERERAERKRPNLEVFAGRFLKLAEQHKESGAALDCLVWILEKTTEAELKKSPTLAKFRKQALHCLECDHLHKAELANVCQRIGQMPAPDCEQLLRVAGEKHALHDVRGLAGFALAQAICQQFEQASDQGKPEAAALFQKAEQQLEAILKEFPSVGYGYTTLGAAAKERLYALRHLSIGRPAPEIEGDDLSGQKLKLSAYRGKVVVLDFWANWCGYCRRMYPSEKQLVNRLKDKPFALLGINCDEDKNEARRVVEREKLNWRSWWDGETTGYRMTSQWQVSSFPTLYVLDHKGVIRHKFQGVPPEKELNSMVERLLKEAEAEARK